MKTTEIAKRAKSRRWGKNLEATLLFHILANMGGTFGTLIRSQIDEIADIEDEVDPKVAFDIFFNWLPTNLSEKLKEEAMNNLVRSSFITNDRIDKVNWEKGTSIHWHIVGCKYRKSRIKTIALKWARSEAGKKWMKKADLKDDCVTTYHWL